MNAGWYQVGQLMNPSQVNQSLTVLLYPLQTGLSPGSLRFCQVQVQVHLPEAEFPDLILRVSA